MVDLKIGVFTEGKEVTEMNINMKSRAVVQLYPQGINHNDLKRLALFFDEIYFVMPTVFTLRHEFLEKKGQSWLLTNGISFDLNNFNFLRDTDANVLTTNLNFQPQLMETLSILEDQGIAKEVTKELGLPIDEDFLTIRNQLASFDVHDQNFNALSETLSVDYKQKLSFQSVIFQLENNLSTPPFLMGIIISNPPKSIRYSHEITTTLYASHETSSFPVFLHPKLKKIMEYRYAQYKSGLEVLKKFSHDIVSPTDFRASFGELTFNIANGIISSELISEKTVEQIIKYRNTMSDARKRFISENLMEISSMIQDNPWNTETKNEIEKYIASKLNKDIASYNESTYETWEKMFGSLTVSTIQILKSSFVGTGVGGLAGGLVGRLIPNTSEWHMLLLATLGAAAGTAVESQNIVKSLVETILEKRKAKRSSIAYIAEFK